MSPSGLTDERRGDEWIQWDVYAAESHVQQQHREPLHTRRSELYFWGYKPRPSGDGDGSNEDLIHQHTPTEPCCQGDGCTMEAITY